MSFQSSFPRRVSASESKLPLQSFQGNSKRGLSMSLKISTSLVKPIVRQHGSEEKHKFHPWIFCSSFLLHVRFFCMSHATYSTTQADWRISAQGNRTTCTRQNLISFLANLYKSHNLEYSVLMRFKKFAMANFRV